MGHDISRRRFLWQAAGTLCAVGGVEALRAQATLPGKQLTSLGVVIYCRKIKRDSIKASSQPFDLYHPSHFLEECLRLGAGGMQADLGSLTDAEADSLHERSLASGRFVEAIINLPQADSDVEQFERDVRVARRAGAEVARTTIIPGRRYERFKSLAEFRDFERSGEQMVRRAIPVLERHGLKLAIENHKDQRNDERLRLFERIDHESVGACVDTGNSIALLEDSLDTIRVFAPWALSVHLKDQAVQRTPTGFLLADIPLGQGCLDLNRMVGVLKTARPDVHFSLELITRDPLSVPCLTDAYFDIFEHLPARDVARTLAFVERQAAESIPRVSELSADQQLVREDDNIRESLRYAAEKLALHPQQQT